MFTGIAIILCCNLFSQQGPITSFKKLYVPEKRWVITHPFVAKKVFRITRFAIAASDSIAATSILDGDATGGRVDAFRHCYWMALLANEIAPRKALKLGKAHEKSNYIQFKKGRKEDGILPDSVSSVMDLYNNKEGVEMGKKSRQKTIDNKQNAAGKKQEYLKQLVIEKIKAGELMVIRKDTNGNYINCNGNIIDMQAWKGKWGIPNCLVKSNHP